MTDEPITYDNQKTTATINGATETGEENYTTAIAEPQDTPQPPTEYKPFTWQ